MNTETANLKLRSAEAVGARYDVVVVGAGLAGTVTAFQLATLGLSVLLVEKKAFPRYKVCGCCLNQRSLNAIEQVGLGGRLESLNPGTVSSVRIHHRGRRVSLPIPVGRTVSRSALDAEFLSACVEAGVEFVDSTAATVMPSVDDEFRYVQLQRAGSAAETVGGRIVVVADGLGQPSLQRLQEFEKSVDRKSRIGLGVSLPDVDNGSTPAGQIQMVVGRRGYVGLVRAEANSVQIAAAVDAAWMTQAGGPTGALVQLLREAGHEVPTELHAATPKGTPRLTCRSNRVASKRLFVLGDSTGYVEPFTGEGMAWALTSAVAASPIINDAICHNAAVWRPEFESRWTKTHGRIVSQHQRNCRFVSRLLRSAPAMRIAMPFVRMFPSAAGTMIRNVNHTPAELIRA